MTTRPIQEFTEYITPDGESFDLSALVRHGRWVLSQQGWGSPSSRHLSIRGPSQHGEQFKRYYLEARTIQLLVRHDFCSREEYWGGRQALVTAIRPNRQNADAGTLRRRLGDGTVRDLSVHLEQGPGFTPTRGGMWDQWGFTEMLRFIASDPVLTDPTLRTVTFTPETLTNLVFPITFPITFGSTLLDDTQNITYQGSWHSYPVFVLTGPLQNPIITNQVGGEVVELNYNIPSGRVVTIDLAYGVKSVTDDLGTNLFGTLDPESDLEQWHLDPDPQASGGVNPVRVQATGAVPGESSIEVQYYDRYVGM